MALPSPSRARRWRAAANTIGIVGIAVSSFFSLRLADGAEDRARARFQRAADDMGGHVATELARYGDIVTSARAAASVGALGSQGPFGAWMDRAEVRDRFPHATSFGWVKVVPGAELDANLRHVERDWGLPHGSLVIDAPPGLPSYCVVQAFYIVRTQESATLPDSCSTAGMSMAAIGEARDSGTVAATMYRGPGVTTDGSPSVTVMSPLFEGGQLPTTVRERRARWTGWVGATLDSRTVLADALEDVEGVGAELTLAGVDSAARVGALDGDLSTTRRIPGGERWEVRVVGASSAFAPSNLDAWGLFVIGVVLSVLVTGFMRLLTTGRQQALALADRRTEELEHLAVHDPLTGLANRTLVNDRVEHLLARSRRTGDVPAALYIDVDGFKEVNDTLGHHAGDELLQAIANRLQGVVRDSDTVGRMGGDEFVVLVEGDGMAVGPEAVAERIIAVLDQPYVLAAAAGEEVVVTASVGVAIGDRRDADELLRDADTALYRAKEEGKDRYVVFDPGMQEDRADRLQLEVDLRSALARGELFLMYQPTLDLRTSQVTGVEALLRWRHPVRGIVPPDQFIPIAEEKGTIVGIGRWVLGEACREAARWHAGGRPIQVSVNVSARQLEHAGFVTDVRSALDATGLPPEMVVLEITETTLMRDTAAAAERLEELKELGVKLAIDDFGTGYSSLAYLQQFPVDALKIDRSFISGIAQSPEADALIHTLVQLGKALDLETLAEGVESQTQVRHLLREECDSAQGFLFARPLPATSVLAFLEEWDAGEVEATADGAA